MNITLTGGTGFIGSHFLELVADTDVQVFALRRQKRFRKELIHNKNVKWIDSELSSPEEWYLQETDVLVHLAAHTANPPYDDIVNCVSYNVNSVIQLFNKAYECGVKDFVVAGSCFEYGNSNDQAIASTSSLKPTNSYACSKAIASMVLEHWAKNVP